VPSRRRAGRYEYALGLLVLCAACSAGGRVPAAPPAPAGGYAIVALGDDFTVGLGTTGCGTQTQSGAPCATSPAQSGAPPTTAAGANAGMMQTFAATFAAAHAGRNVAFTALGVNGALTGKLVPAPQAPLSGNLFANPAQLPQLAQTVAAAHARGETVLVLLESGVDDVLDAAYTRLCAGTVTGDASGTAPPTIDAPCSASGTTLSDAQGNVRNGILYAEYAALFAAIAQSGPDALAYVTVWDLARVPAIAGNVTLAGVLGPQGGAQNAAGLANAALDAAAAPFKGAVRLDLYAFLAANPTYLTNAAYFAPDAFHFDDRGYAALAAFLYQQFSAALPGF
jgi:lysophospholipase L1-like esterase